MSPLAAEILGNARHRAQLGWPIALVTLAAYAPNVGLARLALAAAGLFFLARRVPTASPARRPAAVPTQRTSSKQTPKPVPVQRPAKKMPRQRGANGRWTK